MKYLVIALALMLFAAPAQAAMYRFDAYVEENSWTCFLTCRDSEWNPIPTPEPKHSVLQGMTYTGRLELTDYQALVWLDLPSGEQPYFRVRWHVGVKRYEEFGSVIHYLKYDLSTGLGEFYYQNDAIPFYQITDLRLSNISQVPLPASGGVLLAGLGGLALGRRFKRTA